MGAKETEVADQEVDEEEEIDLAPVREMLDSFPSPCYKKSKQSIDISLIKHCVS